MPKLLDEQICRDLRSVINETDIFVKDSVEKEKFDLTCAVMDRIDSSLKYINDHLYTPKDETEFITFIIHCCTIKDAVNFIFKKLNIRKIDDGNFFKNILMGKPFGMSENDASKIPDDKFFEYFRSLVFAHPFETNRAIPNIIKGENSIFSLCIS